MVRRKQVISVLIVALIALTACATTPLGKAVQTAHVQKQLVEASAVEFAKLHLQGKVPDAEYAKGKAAYEKWAAGEIALATSLADWKRLGDAESSKRLGLALQEAGKLFRTWADVVGQFVDLGGLKAKVGGGA